MRISAWVGWVLLGLTASASVQARVLSWPEVVEYYSKASSGWIQPISSLPDLSSTSFELDETTGVIKTLEAPVGVDVQDLLQLDVAGFSRAENAPDFLTAKTDFYRKLQFDDRTQRYDRPYAYHESWRGLFHPQIKKLDVPLSVIDQSLTAGDPVDPASPYFSPDFEKGIDESSGTEMTFGNQLEYKANHASFEEKLRIVRESKRYLFGIVMVLFCDQSGTQLVDELIAAKHRGVDVRLAHEGLWTSLVNKKCVKRLRDEGIDVLYISDFFKKRSFPGVMHNKFWIKDGEEGIIGGQNLMDSENLSTGFDGRSRDSDVLIKSGPAVTDLLAEYTGLWKRYAHGNKHTSIAPYDAELAEKLARERSEGLRGSANYDRWFSSASSRMSGICRVVVQKAGQEELIAPVRIRYAEAATRSIAINTPKLAFGGKLRHGHIRYNTQNAEALMARARAGVKIDILSNGVDGGTGALAQWARELMVKLKGRKFEHVLTGLLQDFLGITEPNAARTNRKALTKFMAAAPSIRAWTYSQHIHSKQVIYDRTLSSVGSFNMDYNSAETNHESELYCLDSHLRDQMENQLALDLANAVPIGAN